MPPKSPLWKYFHSNKTKYKTDEFHVNAWCKECIEACIRRREAEIPEVSDPPCTRMQHFDAALIQVEPLCGKLKKLEAHLRTCKNLSAEQRTAVSHLLDKENIPPTDDPRLLSLPTYKIQAILEPLAIAANVTQASNTRLDQVLLTLGNLFRIYSTSESDIDADIAYQIQSSLEKRWEKADQDIFILAVFFNPYIRSRMFKPAALSESHLYNIVESVFKRFYKRDGDVALLRAFNDYVKETAEFSRHAMNLDRIKEMFHEENKPLDVVFVWTFMDKQATDEPPTGRNALVKLAIRILTPVPNSAGCERVFSLFGAVHTKYRNKLKPDQVHKIGVVKMDIRRNHIAQGLAPNRQKRKFGEMESTSTDTACPSSPVDPTDFLPLATSLIEEAAADNEEPDLPPIPTPHASSAESSNPPPPPRNNNRKIPLAQLFVYDIGAAALGNGTGLDFYWHGGIKIMQEEVERCDLEAAAEDSSNPTTDTVLTT